MKLNEWAEWKNLSDREIAERMTEALGKYTPDPDPVSVPAVQKYRTGRVPKPDRMLAIFDMTEGWVTANDFYSLPVAQ